jgi:uncharacterized protein YecE (DUF72 family)
MGKLVIGTSGYSYDDWQGPFYPEGLAKEDRLRHYSLFFPFVELNFSYYKMPEAHSLRAMADKTPSSFLFSVKAHQSLTHEVKRDWKDDAELFVKAVSVLAERGKLACVLVQLPYRFHYTVENRVYLSELLSELAPFPQAVEFRNAEWMNERVFSELSSRGAAYLAVDEPELPNLPRPEPSATADIGYVRFHGRNKEAWWSGDNVSRYDYDYSDVELREWLPRIALLREKTKTLYVAFNNHSKGRAVANAKSLKALTDLFSPA